jgi:Ca2+:H+ antiporter
MAVASISAQSSIGMGTVINATFGSIIEIILYAIALESGKGRPVESSIVGSLLAGVLLMPGVSMVAGVLRKKEQRFNAKSAGVTSTMLIMAIIGTLTPTLFYQTFGEVCCSQPSSTSRLTIPSSSLRSFVKAALRSPILDHGAAGSAITSTSTLQLTHSIKKL